MTKSDSEIQENAAKEKEITPAQPEQPKSKGPTQGEKLKEFRMEKGLSLDSVHEATKIPMDALRAIEEGYKIRTLSSFYHKGFVKIYAQYLNVDIGEVIEDYKKEELPKYVKKDVDFYDYDFRPFLHKFLTRQRKQQLIMLIGMIVLFFFIFKVITWFTHRKPKPSKKEVQVTQPEIKKPVVQTQMPPKPEVRVLPPKPEPRPVVRTAPPVVKPSQAQPAIVKPETKNVTLTIRTNKRSWLRVRADGQIVFQSTLEKGAVETWSADEKIEITGKNINQLEFELNGKMIGTLGRKDRKAKSVIVTKEGLSVTK